MPYDPTYAHLDAIRTPNELRERRNELMTKARELSSSGELVGDDLKAFEGLEAEITEVQRRTEQLESLMRHAQNPAAVEQGWDPGPVERQTRQAPQPGEQERDAALRTIERHQGVLSAEAGDRLDRIVRQERFDFEARYLAAVGDPAYHRAFGLMIADPQHGHLRFGPAEVEAVRRVSAIEAERGLVSGVGAQGGFAIPFTLDPSVMLTSSGALNPIRSVANVITIATREWKGVSSAGVTASYDAEASEVSDDTPVLAQPVITTAMGRAFVPFSIEVGMDWAGIEGELARLISDGRDVLDSTMLYSGTGTDQPAGVRTGLTTTQRVLTDVAATFDVDDAYDIKGQLPARFMPNATWAAHPTKWDVIFRFTPSGSTTEPQALVVRDGPFIGRPKIEWTAVPTALTTGTTQLLYGDFRAAFTIADRLGMTAEIVPTLFGATRRPTGERGLFAYWRTGSKTVVPEALRYLETL